MSSNDPILTMEREQFRQELIALIQTMPTHPPLTITHNCGHVDYLESDKLVYKVQADTGEGKRWLDWYIQVAKSRQPVPQPQSP